MAAHKEHRTIKYIIRLLCIIGIAYVACNAFSIWQYGKKDEKRTADAAIVLGAGSYDGEVSPVFRERINHGIWLYQNGYVKKLILTGGYGGDNENSDSYAAKLYAVSQGVPEEVILLEEKSTITQENIQYAKSIMDGEGYLTAILVSDPLHMKRAMRMAEDAGIEAYSSPTPTSRYISFKNKIAFLAREAFFYIGYKVYRLF